MTAELNIRGAQPEDTTAIFGLIQALAEYEQLTHQVRGSITELKEHLFGDRVYAEAIVGELESKIVAFALFFPNYSTFLTKPGIYLEDLFVLPDYRRQGIGTAMLAHLGKIAIERGAGRLEWSVLDWNENAISFYQNIGAKVLPDWRICRVTQDKLTKLADI